MADTFVPPPISSYQGMASEQTVPTGIEGDVIAAARKHGIDEHTFRAAAKNESAFKPDAVSKVGAQGVMQIMPATGRDLGLKDPMDAGQNIEAGAKYWKQLQDKYPGDFAKQAQAYHQGPSAVDRGVPPGPETQKYVARVMKDREAFAGGGGTTAVEAAFTPPPLSSYQGMSIKRASTPPNAKANESLWLNRSDVGQNFLEDGYKRPTVPSKLQGPPSGATGGILDAPSESERRMMSTITPGLYAARSYGDPAVADIGAGVEGLQNPNPERKAHATHQIVSGATRLTAPLAAPAIMAAPGAALLAGATGYGAQQGVDTLASLADVPQGYRELAGDAAALAGAGIPTALRGAGGLAGKVARYGIGKIPYVGKPLVAWADSQIAEKAAVEAAAAKAAAKATVGSTRPTARPPAMDWGNTRVKPEANRTVPPPPVDWGNTRVTPEVQPRVAPPPVDMGNTRVKPEAPPRVPPPPVRFNAPPPEPVQTPAPPVRYNTPPPARPQTAPPPFQGSNARPTAVEQPPQGGRRGPELSVRWPPKPQEEVAAVTSETAPQAPTSPKVSGARPNATEAAQSLKKAVTGKGGSGVETIKSTQPSSFELARANKIANGYNKYLSKLTGGGKISADQVYKLNPTELEAMEGHIEAAKNKQLEGQAEGGVFVPDEPIHFKMGGMVVPDEPRAPQDWSKFKFNRIFSSPSTTHFAQKISSATGSPLSKRTRQLSADNRTFLNFVKTELGTHDPNESVAWVLPESNANVLAQWVGNGARNNLDLGSKKAHTSAVLRLSKAGGRVTLDHSKGPGIYIIIEL